MYKPENTVRVTIPRTVTSYVPGPDLGSERSRITGFQTKDRPPYPRKQPCCPSTLVKRLFLGEEGQVLFTVPLFPSSWSKLQRSRTEFSIETVSDPLGPCSA